MPFVLMFLVALLGATDSRGSHVASAPPDTIALLSDATRPVLALDPVTGEAHVAYVSNGTLHHGWKSGGAWQDEPIADRVGWLQSLTQYGGIDLRVAPDGRVFALFNRLGLLICAERENGTWRRDTLDALPGPRTPLSLAVSPVTGEPTAAWTKRGAPGEPSEIKLARRSGGEWTTQLLDTVSVATLTASVAVDLADRPRVAWGRPRADDDPRQVLTCAMATGPSGPYVSAPVDSQLYNHLAIAVDPTDGEPRIVYVVLDANVRTVRYAAHDAGPGWQGVSVESTPDVPPCRPRSRSTRRAIRSSPPSAKRISRRPSCMAASLQVSRTVSMSGPRISTSIIVRAARDSEHSSGSPISRRMTRTTS